MPSSSEQITPPVSEPPSARLLLWQRITLALFVVGYAGYYLCRVHFAVTKSLLIEEFGPHGLDKKALGLIATTGTAFYAFGKFANGSFADFLGGRRMFLIGMIGAILCTILFAMSGAFPLFLIAWTLNRLLQSAGWVGLTKTASRWFSFLTYGTVMGIISQSYLFGDALSRLFLGQLITWHFGWRGVFFTAAAILTVIFVVTFFLLKESPQDIGEPEPPANPDNVYGVAGEEGKPEGPKELLSSLLLNPTFLVVCVLSFGFTLMRETFNDWTQLYLKEALHMSDGAAGQVSSLFPLFGGLSVLACGYLSDRMGRTGRASIILVGLLLSIPFLIAMAYVKFGGPTPAVLALGAIGFVTLGPYSFLGGAIAMDFGGKRGSATAAGWIDGIGYIGGTYAGIGIGGIAKDHGWQAAFLTLTGVAIASFIAAAVYWILQKKRSMQPESV